MNRKPKPSSLPIRAKGDRADECYVVAGCKPWNRRVFQERLSQLPGRWLFVATREELVNACVQKPRYVFFLHWSWKVPAQLLNEIECVCFHMTDVPYGRGGSPLQNLIIRGHRTTKLTALRMSEEFDAGPVYLKEPLSLEGNAEEIYLRATELSVVMIQEILQRRPKARVQRGAATVFKRRRPEESVIPTVRSLGELHDFVRMLDADGYPRAFIDHGSFRYEFSRASICDGRILADVKITPLPRSVSSEPVSA
jgi:methionyl-tRNA formyltransferase